MENAHFLFLSCAASLILILANSTPSFAFLFFVFFVLVCGCDPGEASVGREKVHDCMLERAADPWPGPAPLYRASFHSF